MENTENNLDSLPELIGINGVWHSRTLADVLSIVRSSCGCWSFTAGRIAGESAR